jgi:CBS domain-containing protein
MRACDVLSVPPVTFRLDVTIRNAVDTLADHGISVAPVADDDGRLIGIVSDTELLDDWLANRAGSRTVADVLTRTVVTLPTTAELSEVASAMLLYDVTSVRLVERGAVVGILSRAEVVRGSGLDAVQAWDGDVSADLERRALRQVAAARPQPVRSGQ